jgi:hypothetical protein
MKNLLSLADAVVLAARPNSDVSLLQAMDALSAEVESRRLTLSRKAMEFTIAVDDDDTEVRGSFASDDADADEALAKDIIARRDRGDVWAWCYVRVQVTYTDAEGRVWRGQDTLGACSYKDEKDFRSEGGYYPDMCDRAFDDLVDGMSETYIVTVPEDREETLAILARE